MACSSRVSALLVFALSLSFTLCTGRAALGDTLPAGSVAGDFNADGRLDVLVQPADATHPGEILLQDGTGALSIQVQVLDPGFLGLDWVRSDSVAHTGDFNGDGRADVLLQSKQSGGVQAILLTDSTSQLDTITQTIPANYMGIDWSAATHTLVTGDFNGDGHSDVLLQSVGPTDLNLIVTANAQGLLNTTGQGWMNNYLGRDWAAADVQLYTGDFNGDGRTDLLMQTRAGHSVGGESAYALLLADSGGQFTHIAQTWNTGDLGADWSPADHTLSVRDINGDGMADIVLTSTDGGNNYAFLGNNGGTFVKPAVTWQGDESAEDALRRASGNGQISVVSTSSTQPQTLETDPVIPPPPVGGGSGTPSNITVDPSGTLAGQSGVNGGAATYSIPIAVPPGRAGMQPSLSLNYSSKGGNGDLGMGWSLGGLSVISRCPETMAQDQINRGVMYSASTDRLCLDGQRLIVVSGTYGQDGSVYRTEMDSGVRVQLSGDMNSTSSEFEVDYTNGSKAYYGANSDGGANNHAVFIPANMSVPAPLVWAIGRQDDAAGNNVTYNYKDYGNGEYHLTAIDYTGTTSGSSVVSGDRRVVFGYDTRSDPSSSYLAGGLTMETQILKTITTYVDQLEVKQYILAYEQSNATDRSLLQSAKECGIEPSDGSGTCFAPTTFTWQDSQPDFSPVHLNTSFAAKPAYNYSALNIAPDYSGTGVSDLRYLIGGSTPDTYILQVDTQPQLTGTPTDESTLFGGAQKFSVISPINQNTQDADFNDDGAADIIGTVGTEVEIAYSNHDSPVSFQAPVDAGIPTSRITNGMVSGDFTGQGLNDIVGAAPSGSNTELYLYVNDGPNASPEQFSLADNQPFMTLTGAAGQGPSISAIGDLDGNGVPDLAVAYATQDGVDDAGVVFLSNTSSDGLQGTYKTYAQMGIDSGGMSIDPHEFMDINGDGLKDLVYYDYNTGTWHYQINQGNQTFSASVDTGSSEGTAPYQLHGLIVAGVRNDGHDDLLYPDEVDASWCDFKKTEQGKDEIDVCDTSLLSGSMSYLDNSIYHYRALSFDENSDGTFSVTSHDYGIYAKHDAQAGDVNGDGLTDLFYSIQRFTGDGTFQNSCDSNCDNGGSTIEKDASAAPDLMVQVKNGLGALADWQYQSLAQIHTDASNPNLPFYKVSYPCSTTPDDFCFTSSMYVVTEYQTSNGTGTENTHLYGYQDAIYNNKGRGFQGFGSITDQFTPYGQSDKRTTTVRTYDNGHPFPLSDTLLTETVTATATGKVLSTISNTWTATHSSGCLPSSSVYWQQLQTSVVTKYGTASDLQSTTTTSYTYDGDGNTTNVDATTTDATGTYEATTVNSYSPDCPAWWTDKYSSTDSKTVTSTVTYNSLPVSAAAATIARTVDYAYDNSLRKVNAERTDPDTVYEVDTAYGFDPYGNTDSVTVSSGSNVPVGNAITQRTTTSDYTNTDGYLADSTTNAEGQTTTITSDPATGEPLTVVAPNGVETSYGYDVFGRKISEQVVSPESLPATYISYESPAAICSGTPGGTTVYSVTTIHAGSPSQTVCYDMLAQPLRTATDSFTSGTESVQDTEYDTLGRVTQTSEPYLSTGAAVYWNKVNSYDVLGRPTEKTDAEGVVTGYVYSGLDTATTTTPTDRPAFTTHATDNSLGKLLSTTDPNSSETDFRYDAQGNPVLIKDAAGNQTVAIYNLLGQKTDVTDPDMGHSVYVYDVLGNLVSQTDAKGQQITQTYDLLNRITRRVMPEKSSTWAYDTCSVGQLCTVSQIPSGSSAADYSKTYTYDALGRVTDVAEQINNGTAYHTSTTYDTDGRVDKVTYPASVGDTAPVASAGADQQVVTGTTVTLDGSGSHDSDGPEPIAYHWTQVSGPVVTLNNADSASASFTAGAAGTTDVFQLTVNDGVLTSSDEVTVKIAPDAPGTLVVPSINYTDNFDVTWGTATGATNYTLYQSTDGTNFSPLSPTYPASPATLTGKGSATSNLTYSYYVKGCANSICGAPGNTASVKVELPPTGPTTISVPATSNWDGSFTISWSGTTGVITTARVALGLMDGGTVLYTQGFCTSSSADPDAETPTNAAASCTFGAGSAAAANDGTSYFVQVTVCNLGNCVAPVQASDKVKIVHTPPPPTLSVNSSSIDAGNSVNLSWSASSYATYYTLQSDSGSGYVTVYSGSATGYTDTPAVPGSVPYRVQACSATACGAWSTVVPVTVVIVPPTITASSSSVAAATIVTLSWTASTYATTYKLRRSGTLIYNDTQRSYTDKPFNAGNTAYDVAACKGSVCSNWSAPVYVMVEVPPAPTVSANPTTLGMGGSVTLSWTATPATTTYYLQYSSGSGYSPVIHGGILSYTDTPNALGANYYEVQACTGGNICGPWSSPVTVTTVVPAAPTLSASTTAIGLGNSVHLSWNAPAYAVSYVLQRSAGSGYTTIYSGASTGFTDTPTVAGANDYRVEACTASMACGSWSSVRQVTAVLPAVPTLSASTRAVTVGGSVTLSWTSSSYATHYVLQHMHTAGYGTAYSGGATSYTMSLSVTGDHYFRVAACSSSSVCSGWSKVKDVIAQSSGGGGGHLNALPAGSSTTTPAATTLGSPASTDVGTETATDPATPPASAGGPLTMNDIPAAASSDPATPPDVPAATSTSAALAAASPPRSFTYAPPVYQYYASARIEPASVTTEVVGLQVQYHYTSTGYLKALTNAVSGRVYWQANALTAQGQIAEETYGNGVVSSVAHADPMSRITGISNSVQDLSYHWDSLGNLNIRTDNAHSLSESFSYDTLNRLTGAVLTNGSPSSPISTTYSYDALGNITCKSDVVGHDCLSDPTGYTYGSSAGPHAVTQVTGTSGGTYTYDADGNMTNRSGTVITWNSDNLPTCMDAGGGDCTSGSDYSMFSYAPDKHRYQQTALTGGVTETTTYVGDYEVVTKNGITTYRHHLSAYGREVAEVDLASSGGSVTETVSYILTDHLGSVDVVMTPSGNHYMSFGAFGERRDVTQWTASIGSAEAQADHDADRYGFTHQEMLDNVNLIHMNGRVYDPNLGRFLSVDPVFQFPTNTQSLNPYSYVLNNPLSMTDPTGYMATCGGDTKDGQQCDLDKVKSSDVESIQKTKNGQYVVNTKDGGSYTVDSASKTVSTGQGGSVTLSSTFNGNGYTNTLSVNSAQNKPTDTASINSPASVSKNQNSRQNTQSGITDIGSQQGAGSETDKGTVINANIKNADPHSIDTMLSISRGMAYRALVAYAKAHPEATAGWSPQDFLKLKMHAVSGIREGEHLCERCVLTVAYYSRETNSVTIFAGAVLATERNNASFADDLLHEFRHSTPWNIISYQRGYSSYGNLPWAERPWEEDAIQFQRSLEPYIHY